MVVITYRHWKTGDLLEVKGKVVPYSKNPNSDRIVVEKDDGTYEDIIKDTIVEMYECK